MMDGGKASAHCNLPPLLSIPLFSPQSSAFFKSPGRKRKEKKVQCDIKSDIINEFHLLDEALGGVRGVGPGSPQNKIRVITLEAAAITGSTAHPYYTRPKR